jgi:hypothetical protein
MSPKSSKSNATTTQQPWKPRIQEEPEYNAFVNDHRSPDVIAPSATVHDAAEDTAPLQGSHDLSDEDSVVADPRTEDRADRRADAGSIEGDGIGTGGIIVDSVEIVAIDEIDELDDADEDLPDSLARRPRATGRENT